jgi:hypothetical protein
MNTLEINDKITLVLLRQWATCDPNGLPALAELLIRSCDTAHRTEAVTRMKEYMASSAFGHEDSVSQSAYPDRIREIEAAAAMRHPDCVNLD